MKAHDRNIILFGSPGVGKGAQADLLSRREAIPHLSTGDLLRDEIARGSDVGRRVQREIDRGRFADDETVLGLVAERIDQPAFQRGFVLDGFPRTPEQAESLDELLRARGRQVSLAILIDAEEETILRRLGGRLVCASCRATFHCEFRPPARPGACDQCGQRLVRRPDDAPEYCRERLRIFFRRTRPVLEHYRARGLLARVDGESEVREVSGQIRKLLEHRASAV